VALTYGAFAVSEEFSSSRPKHLLEAGGAHHHTTGDLFDDDP
jgi:hypothetical protein